MKTAHYMNGKPNFVIICFGPKLDYDGVWIKASGKREARKIAQAQGAKPWNF